ncbi:MAG TPA: hypothetical protein VGD72_04270 [Mycobacteriales bacterium]
MASLADWVADLQASVRRARRRRHGIAAAAAAGVLMLTTVGVALATDSPLARTPPVVMASPSPLPVDDPWLTRPESSAPITRVTPAKQPGGLTVTAHATGDVLYAGQALSVEVTWRDENGRLLDVSQEWGDGSHASAPRGRDCREQTGAAGGATWYRHTYARPGQYLVRFAVTTMTCDGLTERRYVSLPIRVIATPPRPAAPGVPRPTAGPTTPVPSQPVPTTPVPPPSVTPTTPVPSATLPPTGTPPPTGTLPPTENPTENPTETSTQPTPPGPSPTPGTPSPT